MLAAYDFCLRQPPGPKNAHREVYMTKVYSCRFRDGRSHQIALVGPAKPPGPRRSWPSLDNFLGGTFFFFFMNRSPPAPRAPSFVVGDLTQNGRKKHNPSWWSRRRASSTIRTRPPLVNLARHSNHDLALVLDTSFQVHAHLLFSWPSHH